MLNSKNSNKSDSVLCLSTIALFNEIIEKKKYGRYKFSVKKLRGFETTIQTVDRINSLKIEVRSSEKPHNLPHFHVTAPGKIDAVYTINPVAFYKGEIDSKSNKVILKWAEENRKTLVSMWNDFHGYRIKVS